MHGVEDFLDQHEVVEASRDDSRPGEMPLGAARAKIDLPPRTGRGRVGRGRGEGMVSDLRENIGQ